MASRTLTIRAKLALAFGLSLLILCIIGGTALYDSNRLTERTAARAVARQFLWNLEQLVSITRSAENEQRAYLLTGDERHVTDFLAETRRIPAAFGDLERGDPTQRTAVRGLRPLVDRKIATLQEMIDRRKKEGLSPILHDVAAAANHEEITEIQSAMKSIRDAEQATLKQRANDAAAVSQRTRVTIELGTALAFLIIFIVGWLISRSITGPVDKLVEGAERIREGDLGFRIDDVSTDELGRLGQSFNRMADGLQSQNRALSESGATIAERVRVMTRGSESLLDHSRRQTGLTEESTGATEKLREGISSIVKVAEEVGELTQDCASRTMELRALTRQTHENVDNLFESVDKASSSSMEMSAAAHQMLGVSTKLSAVGDEVVSFVAEMEATIDSVRTAARSTADLSARARREAEGGGTRMDATLTGIHASRDTTERAAAALASLQEQIGDISGIVTVIEEITSRTNLLALNAAIIAAQAGQHGRAFTVVADEIRELADRTRRSTGDIRQVISSVQDGSRAAVETMHDGVEHVRRAVEQAGDAATALRGIVANASESASHSERIVHSLEEQTQASRRLREIASNMADLISENKRAVEEQARVAELMAREAERVRDIAAQVKRATDEEAIAEEGIAKAVETIDSGSRHTRALLAAQRREVDLIATAAATMREIAQQNDAVAQELTVTVGVLVARAEQFESEVRRQPRPRAA